MFWNHLGKAQFLSPVISILSDSSKQKHKVIFIPLMDLVLDPCGSMMMTTIRHFWKSNVLNKDKLCFENLRSLSLNLRKCQKKKHWYDFGTWPEYMSLSHPSKTKPCISINWLYVIFAVHKSLNILYIHGIM